MYRLKRTATLQAIPDGREGTIMTLRIMRDVAQAYKTNLAIRETALHILRGVGEKNWRGEIIAVHRFVRDNIRYVRDVDGVETVQTPDYTLDMRAGDCDDKSVLVASLLLSVGHPVRFVAIGKSADNFVHVYPEARIGNGWISVETTEPVEIGWRPDGYPYKLIVNV